MQSFIEPVPVRSRKSNQSQSISSVTPSNFSHNLVPSNSTLVPSNSTSASTLNCPTFDSQGSDIKSSIYPYKSSISSNYTEGWIRSPLTPNTHYSSINKSSSLNLLNRLGGGLEHIGRLNRSELLLIISLTLLAGFVRCWKISRPASVVFDEVHFGGFASKYIRSQFFMDVHPPLVKLLFASIAWICGYDGGFDFKEIGSDYNLAGRIPYIQMRLLPALAGVALVPLSYLTSRILGLRILSATLASILITFESGLIVQSRFILLDSPLLFFTALSVFFHVGSCNEDNKRAFTRRWWIWLTLTGLSLGAVVSSKWVGLFTITAIGLVTINQLWELLGDVRIPIPLLARSFVARFICLAILPMILYLFIFQIHFWLLSNSGDGDAFMSSEFQQSLSGHQMPDTYADVLVGSNVTIKHVNTLGGYLHSHARYYPTGSNQQQVTLYPHVDDNNIWTILGRLADDVDIIHRKPPNFYYQNHVPVNRSTVIRLQHSLTQKRLHSHDIRPPVTEVDYQNEVSGYGFPNFPGDANDEWLVEIVSKESDLKADQISGKRLRSLRTKFRLRHLLQNCYLFSHKVRLPDWGAGQQEVACNRNPTLASSLWYIETNTHPLLVKDKQALKVNYKRLGFFQKFWELQSVMWQTNKALVQHHAYGSRPLSWPVLKRGMNFWVKDHRQIYLLGNPFVWWLGTASIGFYLIFKSILILRVKRAHFAEVRNYNVIKYDGIAGYLVTGWATHYLPFFLMNRQLFLHHYFPSLYYSIILTSTIFDFATAKLTTKAKLKTFVLIVLMTVWSWWVFSPITYASVWTRNQCERARWRREWDFNCLAFHEHLADYEETEYGKYGGLGGTRNQETNYIRYRILEPIRNVFQIGSSNDSPLESVSPNVFTLLNSSSFSNSTINNRKYSTPHSRPS